MDILPYLSQLRRIRHILSNVARIKKQIIHRSDSRYNKYRLEREIKFSVTRKLHATHSLIYNTLYIIDRRHIL